VLMDVTRGFMIPELTFVDAGRMDADGPEEATLRSRQHQHVFAREAQSTHLVP
jgi:hypothetical protein